jgi:hypothetical protein
LQIVFSAPSGETFTKSRFDSSAFFNASSLDIEPKFAPSLSIRITVLALIAAFKTFFDFLLEAMMNT